MRTDIPRVLAAVGRLPWAISEEMAETLEDILVRRASGEELTEAEIQAAIGDRRRGRSSSEQRGGVAVIPLVGVIAPKANSLDAISGGTSAETFGNAFDAAVESEDIRTIVLDVDSPGGQVQGVAELAERMLAARGRGKKVIAVANHLMASAAYWIGSAADEIVAAPTALVGSIGVYSIHVDRSEADAKAGIRRTVIRAGKFKAEGNPFEPLSDEARAAMEDQVGQFYGMFVNAVARHRGVSPADVRGGFGQGRAVTAKDALAEGMIDRIATLAEVLEDLGIDRKRAAAAISASAESDLVELEAEPVTTGSSATAQGTITISASGSGEPAAGQESPNHTAAPTKAEKEDDVMETQTTAAPQNNGAATATVGNDRAAERERVEALSTLAEMHKLTGDLPKWIRDGWTESQAKDHILARVGDQLRMIQNPPGSDLSPKERKRYSLLRAIDAASENDWRRAEFEKEVSDHIAENLPSDYARQGEGFFMPTNLPVEATAIDSATSTAATELVFTEEGEFIDLLRNKMKVRELGARLLSGLVGPVAFPKQTGTGTVSWVAENPGADVAESNITTALVNLNPKTLQSTQATTKQLVRQVSRDVEMLLREDMAVGHALAIDLAGINGSGASNQPTGILNTSGIGSVAGGTNGAAPTYANMVDLETEIAVDNADIGAMAYLTTPGIRGRLKKTETFASTNGQPVWTGGKEGEVNGYPAHVSNQVPSNLTKGTSSGVCHAIIFGVWSQLLIGEWGVIEILVDPYAKKKQGIIEVTSFQMVGLAIRHAAAFAAMKDALTS